MDWITKATVVSEMSLGRNIITHIWGRSMGSFEDDRRLVWEE